MQYYILRLLNLKAALVLFLLGNFITFYLIAICIGNAPFKELKRI